MSVFELSLAEIPFRLHPHPSDRAAIEGRYAPYFTQDAENPIEIRGDFDSALQLPPARVPWPGAFCEERADELVLTRRDDCLVWQRPLRKARYITRKTPLSQPGADVPPYIETALRLLLAGELVRAEGLLMHACGWADDTGAVLFAAFSGGGKTTSALKLPEHQVLSDDQVALTREPGGWQAHALPFVGQWNRRTNPRKRPLQAVALLGKAETPSLRRLRPSQALARLLGCTVSFEPALTNKAFELAASLAESVPVYALDLALDTPLEPWIERMRA